jgi:ferredoxin
MADDAADAPIDPATIGEGDAPPVEAAPYKVIFEATKCIGAGKCAAVSANWSVSIETGLAIPAVYFFGEDDLGHNVEAASVCPAKKDRGVIHVIDRRTGDEIAPDPHGDGTLSVDW